VISVRVKLIGLVVGSLVPAVVGAVATERAAEHELLDEAGVHIKAVGRHFDDLLEEYERHALLAVEFAAHDPHFDRVLAERDSAEVQGFVDQIAAAYPHHEIIATDVAGKAIAIGNEEVGLKSLDPAGSPAFATLLAGERVSGLFEIRRDGETHYGLVDASPVEFEGRQVGALALLTPVDSDYLDALAKLLDADLVLSMDGAVVDATHDHPAPALRTLKEEVLFEEDHDRLFAVETFHPRKLQEHGLSIELTATRDVTELRSMAMADLYRQLLILGIPAFFVLALALWYAHRLAGGVEGIARAARRLEEGEYEMAPAIHTNDEMQLLSESFNAMVAGMRERDRLKETFGRYVTRQVAEHLMERDQELGGELVPVTVLFSDIRSFTTISESMAPRELLDFLNEYFSEMVEAVLFNGGVVDKFIGDAIMAVFGAPVPERDDPLNAVHAALAMREKLKGINAKFAERGLPEIRTGIGLHYGQVVAGNMGHSDRMEYTVIGDAVNVASRLEGLTKELGVDIVCSGDLVEHVKHAVEAEPLKRIKVKGREKEVMVYRVVGLWEDNPYQIKGRALARGR
jgi:adenylate cyclase